VPGNNYNTGFAVIPAKAGTHSPTQITANFLNLSSVYRRCWIPAFAGMTKYRGCSLTANRDGPTLLSSAKIVPRYLIPGEGVFNDGKIRNRT
jgi:hypothetical protein